MNSSCYHCDLQIPSGHKFHLNILNQERYFCCIGCFAIAETICNNHLEDFYRYRSTHNKKSDDILPQEILDLESLDNQSVLDSITSQTENTKTIELGIEGITCAACGWLIKKQISKLPEVQDLQINVTTRRAILKFDKNAPLSPILKLIRKLGYKAFPFTQNNLEKSIQAEDKKFIKRLIIAGLGMMQVMMYATGLYIGEFQDMSKEHANFLHLISAIVATPVVFYSAQPFFTNAWRSIKHLHFGMNLPVSIAILSAYFASVYSLLTEANVFYFDSVVMFTFFLLIGRFLEHRMRLKAILKQQNFNQLLPLSVSRLNDDGTTSTILINDIKLDDTLIIQAGSVVPTDGLLISDKADLNEAILTGEFIPVEKLKNDLIVSGSTNNSANFLMSATSVVKDSRLQQLIKLQNNSDILAQNELSLADKIANWYVIILLLLVCLCGFIWWQIDPTKIFPVILSLLVVSCPCALSLATPTAIATAISTLTDKGLMIKKQRTLLNLSRISDIIFDKTGTLTLGNMTLINTVTYSDISIEECIKIAANLEKISSHPIAHAFKKLNLSTQTKINHQEIISGGVIGNIEDDTYRIGKLEFVQNSDNTIKIHQPSVTELTDPTHQAQIATYLLKNNRHIATFYLADELNTSAIDAIAKLKNSGYSITLLSGDSTQSSQHVANQLNISTVIANTTAEDKLAVVKKYQQQQKKVLMIGDGVNDIGALSIANVSITMGTASDVSQSASDAVLVSQNLNHVAESLNLAKKLDRIIKQNLSWAVVYNLTAIPFAMMGLIPAWAAAIGMTSSSLIVVLNALRLKN